VSASEATRARDPGSDPWAHRRAEPRGLALCWTTYLFLATAVATGSVGLRGAVSIEGMRLAAEMLLVSVGAGVIVLWPMLRLSQDSAPRPGIGWAAADAAAIVIPAQAIIWPQILLARWSLDIAVAASATVAAWAIVVSGALAIAFAARRPPIHRGWWMLLFLALGLAGPIASAISPIGSGGLPDSPNAPPTHWSLLSPVSGLHDLARGAATATLGASIDRAQWTMIGSTVIAGGVLWLIANARQRRLPRATGRG